ncbi:MAG: NADP-dependent isocitrate dehydrogenase [Spirochaetaceae bacterium]|jgi:isocitrate dehydrogenase|nr:NADP-dependent isocitrate dehydrogenase [Spirochaetaceae bacterium]
MAKIPMKTPLAELDGDEMTRVLWAKIKTELLEPYVELKTEYYDLGLVNRDATDDAVTEQAAEAVRRLGVGVKCATITPNAERQKEYNLKKLYPSPNATLRAMLDGTVFRAPITTNALRSSVSCWEKPIVIGRHAYGDVYKAAEMRVPAGAKVELCCTLPDGSENRIPVVTLRDEGIIQAMHNLDESIRNFARSCFRYALAQKLPVRFAAKDTISKIYDGRFRELFAEIYETEFKEACNKAEITYSYSLIDDAVAQAITGKGGFLWACKNYDGDVLSDMIAAASGSLAMMTSVLVSPDGVFEFEAAHGTVQRHYYRHLRGEACSTNPTALIFAWTGALAKRAGLDGIPELAAFAASLEQAVLGVIELGIMTADLRRAAALPVRQILDSDAFIAKIKARL